MPMDPMDVMWMSKPPTVSDVVTNSNVVFKPAVSPQSSSSDEGIRPDFDTDVLWKPPRLARKERTVSLDSNDSETGRKLSFNETGVQSGGTSPVDVPRTRRLSITERIFGSPSGGFSWGQASQQIPATSQGSDERKMSVTDDARFKELMKHQNKILGDDGVGSSFKRSDYMNT